MVATKEGRSFVIPAYHERENPPKAFDSESTGDNRVGDQPDARIIPAIGGSFHGR